MQQLATFLDFQACTNAVWDGKDLCAAEYRALRQRLEKAGLGLWIEEYLSRLGELESRRPSLGGGRQRFDDVRSYREAVVRLSLATITAIALKAECLEDAIRATDCDSDVAALFRNGDAMPDHRRRRGLQRGSVGGLAEFPDSSCVAAAGHGIDCGSCTVLCRES